MSTLVLEGVSVRFLGATQDVVDQVSLSLEAGDIASLLGPSGCGKSTILRAVAGFESVSQGRILAQGRVLSGPGVHIAPEHRGVGLMFQELALFPHLNVERNVGFGLRRWTVGARRAQVDQLLRLVGLPGAGRRMPHELSGGQQQRVALARALAPSPRILLLDEPFSSLDESLRQDLCQEVRDILKSAGQTALMVTHDPEEAQTMGDWVGQLQAGRLQSWLATPGAQARRLTPAV